MIKEDIINLLLAIDALEPYIKEVLGGIKKFGPDIKSLAMETVLGLVDIKTECVRQFERNGFSTSQAIELTNDMFANIKSAIERK